MAAISSLLLWAIACIIEARNDRGLETYHNWLKDAPDVEAVRPKGAWYNPAKLPARWDLFGWFRDPWHKAKLVYYGIITTIICLAAFAPYGLPHWYCLAGSIILIRAVVFPLALKVLR